LCHQLFSFEILTFGFLAELFRWVSAGGLARIHIHQTPEEMIDAAKGGRFASALP
jgi:hypothetical protein